MVPTPRIFRGFLSFCAQRTQKMAILGHFGAELRADGAFCLVNSCQLPCSYRTSSTSSMMYVQNMPYWTYVFGRREHDLSAFKAKCEA